MSKILIDHSLCDLCGKCVESCPFSAISINNNVEISAACKLCKVCIKSCPKGAITFLKTIRNSVDKSLWKGIMVYVEHINGNIHPITIELIGKARELAVKINQPVFCVLIGASKEQAAKLLQYGVDKVFVYDHKELTYYRSDIYTDVFAHLIREIQPSIVLVGGTSVGRSLAPKLSTRFKTGLTADCTSLEVRENSDLVQIRPAFGGNIMAQIVTPDTRPQFATVRYKVMERANKIDQIKGEIVVKELPDGIKSNIKIIKVIDKKIQSTISDADIIVAGGRGLKSKNDFALLENLADALGGQTAVTRPLVEAGWAPCTKQIGLSGRTVKPQLIITCGISGAIQFTACMQASSLIIAINKDEKAPIFKIAHYCIVGDLYEILPSLLEKLKRREAIV